MNPGLLCLLLSRAVAFALMLWSSYTLGGQEEAISEAKEFAQEAHHCGLDHGYQCRTFAESDFIGLAEDKNMVPGNYLVAWQIALAEFRTIEDLTAEEKELQHYKFGFSENDTQYVVHFQALLLPAMSEGKSTGIMRGTFGRTTRYWINKKSMQVEKRLFYK